MHISLDWLQDYVKIPKDLSPEELAQKLTLHTVEIDKVIKEAEKYKNIVVGKITEVKPHPNADKLRLAVVDIKKKTLEIVCGAPNIKAGQMVPLALADAVLPNGLEIKETEIRGVRSAGMLCAEDELGLGEDHAGILILDEKAKIGQDFGAYLDRHDVIFEVDNKTITNRPDLWGHFGLAREIAAFLNITLDEKALSRAKEGIYVDKEEYRLDIKIDDKELCPRYVAAIMDGITVKKSPAWLQKRLAAVGVRPINNIVDITNYVMLELGQPLHAFDAYGLNPGLDDDKAIRIGVRGAKKKEAIKTLDLIERELGENMLLITDQKKAVAIAGVMGTENSGISDQTKKIVLEAANFDFVSIRKTSAALGLRTEASKRFEKSLDPLLCPLALARAILLIKEVCPGAKVAGQTADIDNCAKNTRQIELDLNWLASFLGLAVEKELVVSILGRLGFETGNKADNLLLVEVPSWRAAKDISRPQDLAEEVARVYGYNNIEPLMPKVEMQAPKANQSRNFENEIKAMLCFAGLSEVYNYSFIGEEQLVKMGINPEKHIRLFNPIAKDRNLLRQSLVTNMIANIAVNQARLAEIQIFEIGNVFLPFDGRWPRAYKSREYLPGQEKRLAIICAGEADADVMDKAKSWLEFMAAKLKLDVKYTPQENIPAWVEVGHSAQILVNNWALGQINKASQAVCRKCGIKKHFACLEINLLDFFNVYEKQGDLKFKEFTRYPRLIRDLAFVVNEKVLYNDIKEAILNFHEYIFSVELFDVYCGEKLGKGNKSLAFRVSYQADKTLTGDEADKIQTGLLKKLETRFGAKIRDF